MKQLLRIFSLSLVLLLPIVHSAAQAVAQRPKDTGSIEIYRNYNKGKDQTVTETGLMSLEFSSEVPIPIGLLDMNVFYTYPGKTPVAPVAVTIKVISDYEGFQSKHDLTIVADGEIFQLGKMQYRKRATGNNVPGVMRSRNGPADSGGLSGFTGEMSAAIPVETFKRIANAQKVHLKIGPMDRDLHDFHLEKMRGLLSAMTQ
ncbi:MAG TPA: hypothetical protein VF708_11920 [Pyrinomonadaceae bacterium]|jgi:hypothetical protein